MDERPDDWDRGWTALQHFVAVRGTAAVPSRAMAGGVALGSWADARRQDYWAGELDPSHVDALESLPGWRWEGRSQRRWEARFAALNRYLAEHGPTTPPSNALSGKLRVGEWAAKQRRAHAAGTLPTPLVEKLESLPGWRWHGDDRWRRGFAAVRGYLAQHTTLESVDHVEIDGFALGNWVQRCREDYHSRTLSHAQIDDLESLPGWTWSGPDERWRQGFAALRAYYVRYGSARPPQKTVITGFALGQWVHHRRRDYQLGTLSPDRVAELESLPTWTWAVQPRRQKPRADDAVVDDLPSTE
jgi:hypothetical protein